MSLLILAIVAASAMAQQPIPILKCPSGPTACNDILKDLPPWCPNPWDSCTGSPPLYHPFCGGVGDFRDCFVQCATGDFIEATRGQSGCWVTPCAPGTKWCDATCDCQHKNAGCPEGDMSSPAPIPAGVGVAEGILAVNSQATLTALVDQLQDDNGGDDDALDAFEESIGSYSKRRYLNDLEDVDGVDLSDSPDVDFLFDSLLETILSPDGKILIGTTGYIVTRKITYELQGVSIQDLAAADVADLSGYTVVQHQNDPDGGAERERERERRNLQAVTPCDGWRSCKAETSYNGGNRKFRGCVWVRNLPFYASFGTRTKHYRRTNSGNWRRERADNIWAVAGVTAVDLNCQNEDTGSFADERENRKSVQESRTFWAQVTRAHEMVGVHGAQDNGVSCQRSLDLFECDNEFLSCDPPGTSPTPTPSPSCMAGSTGVVTAEGAPSVKAVQDLEVGDEIYGLDENGDEDPSCTVEAKGYFGEGAVYGNYTENHYIVTPDGNGVAMHGKDVGLEVTTHKYAVLTSCPAGTDESGTHFTPLDTDFFGEDVGAVSWSDYVLIHRAILSLVRASGGFWFNPSTYSSMSTVKEYTPAFYTTLLQCVKTRDAQSAACSDFEVAASMLVEFSLTDEARALGKSYFSFDQVATTQEEGAKAEDEAAPEAPAAATGTSVSASVSNVVLGV